MSLITTFILSFLIILGVIGIMAIGVLFGSREIRGSCGGIANRSCEICGNESDPTGTSGRLENKQFHDI